MAVNKKITAYGFARPAQKPVKPSWSPQKGIPDQNKIKNSGLGWGGEKPTKK